jgi:hypothetical protein
MTNAIFLLFATIALLFVIISLLSKSEPMTATIKPTKAHVIKPATATYTANSVIKITNQINNINSKAPKKSTMLACILATMNKLNTTINSMQQQQHQPTSTTPTACHTTSQANTTCSPPQSVLHHRNNFTAISDTGASHHYCHGRAPTTTFTNNAPPTTVNIANGACIQSIGQAKLLLPNLPPGTKDCHIMSSFTINLLSMGIFCDTGCIVIFTGTDITVIGKTGTVILQGFHEQAGARMWRFNIYPKPPPETAQTATQSGPCQSQHAHEPHFIPFDDDHHTLHTNEFPKLAPLCHQLLQNIEAVDSHGGTQYKKFGSS